MPKLRVLGRRHAGDPQNGDVDAGIDALDLGRHLAPVVQRDAQRVLKLDDVVVGDDQVFLIEKAGAGLDGIVAGLQLIALQAVVDPHHGLQRVLRDLNGVDLVRRDQGALGVHTAGQVGAHHRCAQQQGQPHNAARIHPSPPPLLLPAPALGLGGALALTAAVPADFSLGRESLT